MTLEHIPKGGYSGQDPNVREQWVTGANNYDLLDIGQQDIAHFDDLFEIAEHLESEVVTIAGFGIYEDYDGDPHWYAHNVDIYDYDTKLNAYWERWQAGEFDSEEDALTAFGTDILEVEGAVDDIVGFSVSDHYPSGRAEP